MYQQVYQQDSTICRRTALADYLHCIPSGVEDYKRDKTHITTFTRPSIFWLYVPFIDVLATR